MQIVDSHAHFFGPAFFGTLAAASPLPGTVEERLALLADRLAIDLPSSDPALHLQRWLADLDDKGVDHAVCIAGHRGEADELADVLELAGDRLTGIATVDPTRDSPAEVRRLLSDAGFRGIALFPALHGFEIDGEAARSHYAVLAEFDAACYVHCGELNVRIERALDLAPSLRPTLATPLAIVPVACDFPSVPFIVPRLGSGFLRETMMAGAQCENILVDTSSRHTWLEAQVPKIRLADVLERVLAIFGTERILFGTGSRTFPVGWRVECLDRQKTCFSACGLSDEGMAQIFAGNALRLFGN